MQSNVQESLCDLFFLAHMGFLRERPPANVDKNHSLCSKFWQYLENESGGKNRFFQRKNMPNSQSSITLREIKFRKHIKKQYCTALTTIDISIVDLLIFQEIAVQLPVGS